MKTFKQFIKEYFSFSYKTLDLHEELSSDQKREVDSWGEHPAAKSISHHVMGDNDRITIPLSGSSETVEPHPDVKAHLESHGYSVSDYKSGFAKDMYGRQVSIGKILNKTKAPQHITHTFNTDPKRMGSNASGAKIIISRHPHDVCGMSTNRGWNSCMTMPGDHRNPEGGMYNKSLRSDVEHGTHVAYLVHPHDDAIQNPIARIALKPFHTEDKSKTILRPESTVYGIGKADEREGDLSPLAKQFKQSVHSWATTHFPAEDGVSYHKNENVYHDSGSRSIYSLKDQLRHEEPHVVQNTFTDHFDKITPEHIAVGMRHPDAYVQMAAISHPAATKDQVSKGLESNYPGVRRASLQHKNAPMDRIENVIHNKFASYYDRIAALKNPNLTANHLSPILKDHEEDEDIQKTALSHPNVSSEDVNNTIKNKDAWAGARMTALKHPKADPQLVKNVINDPHESTSMRTTAMAHPSVKSSDLYEIATNRSNPAEMRRNALKSPKLSDRMLTDRVQNATGMDHDWALENPNIRSRHLQPVVDNVGSGRDNRMSVIGHSAMSSEQLHKVITNENEHYDARRVALNNRNVSSETLNHVFTHMGHHDDLQAEALSHPNLPAHVLSSVTSGSNTDHIKEAMKNPNITSEHLDKIYENPASTRRMKMDAVFHNSASIDTVRKAFSSDNEEIRNGMTSHPKMDDEELSRMMKHPNPDVRRNAIGSQNAGRQTYKMAIKDKDENVRMDAIINRGNYYMEPHHVDAFINDPSPKVRLATALSRHATSKHLAKLAYDPDKNIRHIAAGDSRTPTEHLKIMSEDDADEDVKNRAKKTLEFREKIGNP